MILTATKFKLILFLDSGADIFLAFVVAKIQSIEYLSRLFCFTYLGIDIIRITKSFAGIISRDNHCCYYYNRLIVWIIMQHVLLTVADLNNSKFLLYLPCFLLHCLPLSNIQLVGCFVFSFSPKPTVIWVSHLFNHYLAYVMFLCSFDIWCSVFQLKYTCWISQVCNISF